MNTATCNRIIRFARNTMGYYSPLERALSSVTSDDILYNNKQIFSVIAAAMSQSEVQCEYVLETVWNNLAEQQSSRSMSLLKTLELVVYLLTQGNVGLMRKECNTHNIELRMLQEFRGDDSCHESTGTTVDEQARKIGMIMKEETGGTSCERYPSQEGVFVEECISEKEEPQTILQPLPVIIPNLMDNKSNDPNTQVMSATHYDTSDILSDYCL